MIQGKSVGALFKEARLSKQISLEDASYQTKIHANVLKAIESDDFSSLGAVYAKSFLKLYAEYLGLSKEEVLGLFKSQNSPASALVSKKKENNKNIEPAGEGIDVLLALRLWVGRLQKRHLIIFAVFLVLWLVAGQMRSQMKRGAGNQKKGQSVVKKGQLIEKKKDAPAKIVRSSKETAPASSKSTVGSAKTQTASPEKEKAPQGRYTVVLVVKAREKTWLQVKVDGKIVFQNILNKGASEVWQARDKIELWLGNAGGVGLELNGKTIEKVGRPGQVLKRVVVTRNGLSIQR